MSNASPIWLLSAPFSGSAWVAGCLHQHPDLYALPQLDLLLADTIGDALKVFDIGQGTHGQGLLRAVAWLVFERQDDSGIHQAKAWLKQCATWSCGQLIDHLAEIVAPQRLVIPDEDGAFRSVAFKRMLSFSDSPTVAHLTRHPWSQGILMQHWAKDHIYAPADYKDHSFIPPPIEPQLAWYAANKNLLAWQKLLPESSYLRISSEQAESENVSLWAPVCEQLGITNSTAIHEAMHNPVNWLFAQPGPPSAPAGLDAETHAKFPPETLQLANQTRMHGALPWRADGKEFDEAVKNTAEELGYPRRA